MKFLVDAHLPRRLAKHLAATGHDAIHTLDLPDGNRTSDQAIITLANNEARVVVTKDADFVSSFLVARQPRKLLLISTGNINNNLLFVLFDPNLTTIVEAFEANDFLELTRNALIIRG